MCNSIHYIYTNKNVTVYKGVLVTILASQSYHTYVKFWLNQITKVDLSWKYLLSDVYETEGILKLLLSCEKMYGQKIRLSAKARHWFDFHK